MHERSALNVVATILCVAALVVGPAATKGDERPTPASAPAGVLWLEGTSNVHDYESRTTDVRLTITWAADVAVPSDASALAGAIRANGVRGLELEVPVTSLRSGKDKLDRNLRRALRADESPTIRFRLAGYTLKPLAGDTLEIEGRGVLQVAGRDRETTIVARTYRDGDGVWLDGSKELRMTEFDVKPPTMMLGALRVKDPVQIHFHLLLTAPKASSGSKPAGSD